MAGNQMVFHEDVFYEYFKPVLHPEAQYQIWGGHGLETFGKDLEIVRSHNPVFVWTVLDGCFGSDQWIVPGPHFANRVCYLTTEIPHNWINVEFKIPRRLYSLTELGLKRQMSKLTKLMMAPRDFANRMSA